MGQDIGALDSASMRQDIGALESLMPAMRTGKAKSESVNLMALALQQC